ncbi:sulfotransferase [Pelomyxa schiedti]|nr:sulfotransferase [Pelomyxa schiedti]
MQTTTEDLCPTVATAALAATKGTSSGVSYAATTPPKGNAPEAEPLFIPADQGPLSWLSWGLDYLSWGLSWLHMDPLAFSKSRFSTLAREFESIAPPEMGDCSAVVDGWELWAADVERRDMPRVAKFVWQIRSQLGVCSAIEAAKYLRATPLTPEMRPRKVLFITGLPRTGTTLLHNLLHVDLANRCLHTFEMVSPVPPAPSRQSMQTDPRLTRTASSSATLELLFPGFRERANRSHFSSPESVEEELFILGTLGVSFSLWMDCSPEYKQFLLDENKDYLYHWLCSFLTMENSGWAPTEAWVLKCPFHSLYLNSLSRVFQDAGVIFMHRDPTQVIASWCALVEAYTSINWYPNTFNRAKVGRSSLELWSHAFGKIAEWQHNTPAEKYFNLNYQELMADPIAAVQRIYSHFRIPFTAESRDAMKQYLVDNPQGKHGRAAATLEMYGLTKQDVTESFHAYMEAFFPDSSPPTSSTSKL